MAQQTFTEVAVDLISKCAVRGLTALDEGDGDLADLLCEVNDFAIHATWFSGSRHWATVERTVRHHLERQDAMAKALDRARGRS